MTESELARIEEALGLVLPAAYRTLVVPFPLPAYVGNAETELWDDPDQLIELNRELRAGTSFVRPWPAHMFAMGRDDSGCASAIDLQDPASPVWWVDRCHLDTAGSGQVSSSLAPWAEQYLFDLRSDLRADLIDPDGSPEARASTVDNNARAGCQFTIVLVGIGVVLVLAVLGLVAFFVR